MWLKLLLSFVDSQLELVAPGFPVLGIFSLCFVSVLLHRLLPHWSVHSVVSILDFTVLAWFLPYVDETFVKPWAVLLYSLAAASLGTLLALIVTPGTEAGRGRARFFRVMPKSLLCGLGLLILLLLFHVQAAPKRWEEAVIALKWKHQAQFAGFYVAQQRGLYRDRGLHAALLPGGPDPGQDCFDRVRSGAAILGVGDPITLIEERAKGHGFVALATIYERSPARWFLRRPKTTAGVFAPGDLVGKSVAVSSGRTNVDKELELWLRQNDLFEHRVFKDADAFLAMSSEERRERHADDIVHLPMRRTGLDSLKHFLVGSIDVWTGYSSNELVVAEELLGPDQLLALPDTSPAFGDIIFTTREKLETHRELIEQVWCASRDGWSAAADATQEPEVLSAIMEYMGDKGYESEQHQLRMLRVLRDDHITWNGKTVGSVELGKWADLEASLRGNGMISVQLEPEALVSREIVDTDCVD